MEGLSQGNRLNSLLDNLSGHVKLEKDEMDALVLLNQDLEEEFGDLPSSIDEMIIRFLPLYNGIFAVSPLKRPFSEATPELFFRDDYYDGRDAVKLERLYSIEKDTLKCWSDYFADVILPGLFRNLDGEVVNGGIKSPASLKERMESRMADDRPQPLNRIRDLIRGRFIGKSIRDVEKALGILRATSMDEIVSFVNYYCKMFIYWREDHKIKPHLAANIVFRIDDDLAYELQVMTKRASIIGKLDHPVRVKRSVDLSQDQKKYLEALTWGSHLHDFREY